MCATPSTHRLLLSVPALLALLAAPPTRGELLLAAEHTWGVESPLGADEVIEYLVCDQAGTCAVLDKGDEARAFSPIRVNSVVQGALTLRARYCIATPEGDSSGDCGPLSEPGASFRYQPMVPGSRFVSVEKLPGGSPSELQAGETLDVMLPLGMSLPLAEPTLRFDLVARERGTRVLAVVRGVRVPENVYFMAVQGAEPEQGILRFAQAFPGLEEAIRAGETELRLRLRVLEGTVTVGQDDLTSRSMPRAPHITGAPLFGTLVTFFDSDADGVPYWPARDATSCGSLRWTNCFDNCNGLYNPDQLDADGDGVGDACAPPPADPLP